MPQFTRLNRRPYHDDFNESSIYHRILFVPGRAIQARELTQIQSQIQSQIERFGSYFFSQGQQIVPGELNITNDLSYVKISFVSDLTFIDSSNNEVSITYNINDLKNKRIRGRNSGITATVVDVQEATDDSSLTLFVNYEDGGFSKTERFFRQGEVLTVIGEENTTPEFTVATNINGLPSSIVIENEIVSNPPTGFSSAIKVEAGVYYINGFFVRNEEQLAIIDPYNNRPNAKAGFLVNEEVVTEKSDSKLFDNSRGSNNFRAPGSHRLAINLVLSTYDINQQVPNNFIEIATISKGKLESQIALLEEPTKVEYENYITDQFFLNINKDELEISQGSAFIGGKLVENTKTKKFLLEKSTDTFITKNKTINASNLPHFKITDVVGSSPLNGDNPELSFYPNVLLSSIKDSFFNLDTAVRTILVQLRNPNIWSPNESLWLRLSNNEVIEPKELKVISYRRINEQRGTIELTLEGDANTVNGFLVNYNTNSDTYDNLLYSTQGDANDVNNSEVPYYGTITYYTETIFPVIGRVKPLDTKLLELSNTFNPDKDSTVPSSSTFSFSYFDPQYLTKIVLRTPILTERRAFNVSTGSYIYSLNNDAYGSIERVINNQILIIKTIYGEFKQGESIKDNTNKVVEIAEDSTISHLIIKNPLPVSDPKVFINGIELDSNKYSITSIVDVVRAIHLKDHYTKYDSIPNVQIKDGTNKGFVDLKIDAFLHSNSVMTYNKSDIKSLYCVYGESENVFSANLILDNKTLLDTFTSKSNYSLFSLGSLGSIRENALVEYVNTNGERNKAYIQSFSDSEIVLDRAIVGNVQGSDILLLSSSDQQSLNTLVFPTGSKKTSQIFNSTQNSSINYYYKRDFITTATTGSNSITFQSNLPFGQQRFAPFNKSSYLLTVIEVHDDSPIQVGDIIHLTPEKINISGNAISISLDPSIFGIKVSGATPLPILKLTATVIHFDSKPKVKSIIRNKRIIVSNFGDPIVLLRGRDYDSNSSDILSYSDVIKVHYVYQGNSTQPPEVGQDGELNTLTGEDVMHRYIIDNGQRDTFYDVGRLVLKPSENPATGQLVIGFDYLEHSNENYSTVDSYKHDSGLIEEDIGSFNSNVYGDVSLTNIIDFRPKVDYNSSTAGFGSTTLLTSTTFEGNGASLTALPASFNTTIPYTIEFDEKQYLDRIDAIFFTKDGKFLYKKGNSSLNPSRPNDIQDAILVCYLYVPAFTKDYKDIKIIQANNNQYKKSDIGNLEKRVERLEYYTSQSVLEQQAQQMQIKDNFGLERYKVGFIADAFEDHKFGNIANPVYSCSIDPQESTLKPEVYETSIELKEHKSVNPQYVINNNVASLPFSARTYISNTFSSSTVNPNPFITNAFKGEYKLTPNIDSWYDELTPPLIQNDSTSLFSVAKIKDNGLSSIHNSYLINWLGVVPPLSNNTILPLNTTIEDLSKKEDFALTASSSNISPQNNVLGKGITPKSVGNKLINSSIQFYGRKRLIKFVIHMLKPNTEHHVILDDIDIRRWVNVDSNFTGIAGNSLTYFNNRLFSDKNGNLSGVIIFPNGSPPVENERWTGRISNIQFSDDEEQKFLSGIKDIIFTSDPSSETPISSSTLKYYITGITQQNTPDISSTRPIDKSPLRAIVNVDDQERITPNPLSQVFNIQNSPGGVCLTGVDLFFKSKPNNLPVRVFITPTNDGIPTDEVVPGSSVVKLPTTKIRVRSIGRNTIFIGETILGLSTSASGILIEIVDRNQRTVIPNIKNEVVLESGQPYTMIIDSTSPVSYKPNEELRIDSIINANAETNQNNLVLVDHDRGSVSLVKLENTGENYETAIANVERPQLANATNAIVSIQLHDGKIYSASLVEPGTGYSSPPTISIRGTGPGSGGGVVTTELEITSPAVEMGVILNQDLEPPTRFTFDYPVFLQNNKSYALIVQTDSNQYILTTSKVGDLDKTTSNIITDNPNLGILYKSQNVQSWKEEQNESLKVVFYNAEFDIRSNGELVLSNSPLELDLLQTNPFETNSNAPSTSNSNLFRGNNSVIRVHHKNHGFEDNGKSFVYFSNATPLAGIGSDAFNQAFYEVSNIGLNDYTIKINEQVASNVFGGGNSVYASANKKFETLYPQLNVLEVDNTDIKMEVKTTNIVPVDNTIAGRNYQSYSESVYEQTFINEVHRFDNQKVVASSINEVFNRKPASLYYKLTLSSKNRFVSPMVDISNATVKLQTNKIEFATGTESRFGIQNQRITLFPVFKILLSRSGEDITSIQGRTTNAKGEVVLVDENNLNLIYVKVTSTNNFQINEQLDSIVNGVNDDRISIASNPEKVLLDIAAFSTITARSKSHIGTVYSSNIDGRVIYNQRSHDTLLISQYNEESSGARSPSNDLQEKDVFRKGDLITYNGQPETQRKFWEVKTVIKEHGVDYIGPESFNSNDVMTYETKEININETAMNLDVRVTANVKETSQVLILYKIKPEYSQDDFESIKWKLFEETNELKSNQLAASNFNERQENYQELKYSVSELNPFSSFAIKVVLRSIDPTLVPKLQDLRCVASI